MERSIPSRTMLGTDYRVSTDAEALLRKRFQMESHSLLLREVTRGSKYYDNGVVFEFYRAVPEIFSVVLSYASHIYTDSNGRRQLTLHFPQLAHEATSHPFSEKWPQGTDHSSKQLSLIKAKQVDGKILS